MQKFARNAALVGLVIFVGMAAYVAVDYFEPTKQEAIQEANDKSQIDTINILAGERVAYYTKVLAIFTGTISVLGLLQIWFLRRADETNRLLAQSAKRTAEAAIGIELPIINAAFPELVATNKAITSESDYTGGGINDGPPTEQTIIHRMDFRNAGRTPAFPTKIDFGWACIKSLPSEPVIKTTVQCKPLTLLKEQSEATIDAVFFVIRLSSEEVAEGREGNFWLYGRIYYADFLGERHSQGFCWRRPKPRYGLWVFERSTDTPAAYTSKEDC